jgi:hypothetical protein
LGFYPVLEQINPLDGLMGNLQRVMLTAGKRR